MSSNSEVAGWADQGLGKVGSRALPPNQVVSKNSQEQEELNDDLRSRPRELQDQNQKSQTFQPSPWDAGADRGTEPNGQVDNTGAAERPGIGCEQVGRA